MDEGASEHAKLMSDCRLPLAALPHPCICAIVRQRSPGLFGLVGYSTLVLAVVLVRYRSVKLNCQGALCSGAFHLAF